MGRLTTREMEKMSDTDLRRIGRDRRFASQAEQDEATRAWAVIQGREDRAYVIALIAKGLEDGEIRDCIREGRPVIDGFEELRGRLNFKASMERAYARIRREQWMRYCAAQKGSSIQ